MRPIAMSWHNGAILVHADFSDNLQELFGLIGLKNARRRADWDIHLGDFGDHFPEGLGQAVCDGWTCLVGVESCFAINDQRLAPLASRADLLAWQLEGSCGYGSYEWWQGGKKRRHWEEMEGRILRDEGPRLFEGDELPPEGIDSEDHVFRAMAALAIPLQKLWDRPLAGYEFPRNRFREWIRRWLRL
jgi:hypothetical protein